MAGPDRIKHSSIKHSPYSDNDPGKKYGRGEPVGSPGLRTTLTVTYASGEKEQRLFTQFEVDMLRASGAKFGPPEEPKRRGRTEEEVVEKKDWTDT